jgi:GxxExxY protein
MGYGDVLPQEVERAGAQVVDGALTVHRALGPGLLESVYEICLYHELTKRGVKVERQVEMPIIYEGIRLDAAMKLDLLVENAVVVEVKAVEKMMPVFNAQVLTYLKLTEKRLAFLINFNVPLIKDGIRRIVR